MFPDYLSVSCDYDETMSNFKVEEPRFLYGNSINIQKSNANIHSRLSIIQIFH